MKRPVLFLCIAFGIILVLSGVQVVISARLSTTGVELSQIEEELDVLRRENSLFTEQILRESSYNRIASKSAEQGFVENTENFSLASPVVVAKAE